MRVAEPVEIAYNLRMTKIAPTTKIVSLLAVLPAVLVPMALAQAGAVAEPEAEVAQTRALPHVHVIATGGTIAGIGYDDVKDKDANALVAAVPQLAEIAYVTNEDPYTVPSSQLTPDQLLSLVKLLRKRLAEDPNLSGIVVTQGTDSLEEAAFFVDLTVDSERPIVFTGAMRRPGQPGTDGAVNLMNAVRLAASPAARGMGVLVTLHDQIHAAREVRKTDSTSLSAFESPSGGALGFFDEGRIFLLRRPSRRLSIPAEEVQPRVHLVTAVVGSDGQMIRSAVEAGTFGIVVELFGRGNPPGGIFLAMREALGKGIPVVVTTRTRRGPLSIREPWKQLGAVYAEDLDALKARLVLIAALPSFPDQATLQGYFDSLSGWVH